MRQRDGEGKILEQFAELCQMKEARRSPLTAESSACRVPMVLSVRVHALDGELAAGNNEAVLLFSYW